MTRIGTRIAFIVLTVMAVAFLPACGLKDDLYIPSEEVPSEEAAGKSTPVPPAQEQSPGEEVTSPDDETGSAAADRLPESAP